ncbi:MAG: bifunctional UDP-N-acetylglucosamine diphosphorylase/glucosamine-1-phosphate N-acetyltransferase GlmU [Actinobacteria bacterium]|nr:bifunctional UDP-N-acetylglucosamine diphosphorylase/glucosamine-1-phosphate N-acetyltransferase GlmU [Actinomycetota bacterium]
MSSEIAAVIMAGGLGTRMRSATPKHFHPLLGRRMVDWVVGAAAELAPEPLVVVTSPENLGAYDGVAVAVQKRALGTGDAVRSAAGLLEGFDGDVLILNGDVPALRPDVLRSLVEVHRDEQAAATVLSFEPKQARHYGRILRDGDRLLRIVEAVDASDEELVVPEVNSGMYVFRADALWPALERLEPRNKQGELYITDAVGFLVEDGGLVAVYKAPDPLEAEGVNTRAELAATAALLRNRINEEHMLAGVSIADPGTTWIDHGVELEADATVHPFTVLRGSTRMATGAEIGPHAVAHDAEIGPGAVVGPFCYLRPGTVLAAGAKAGTFVEIKNARVGERSKVPHLSYIGDAEIGEDSNIGAGAITANFPHEPGQPKQQTKIGKNVRTAVHNAFVAPVEIGDDSWTAAGSVITDDVPPGSLAGFPPRQITKEGYVSERAEPDDGD